MNSINPEVVFSVYDPNDIGYRICEDNLEFMEIIFDGNNRFRDNHKNKLISVMVREYRILLVKESISSSHRNNEEIWERIERCYLENFHEFGGFN